jgi:mono/diheme cytochrome c family protein
MRVSWIAAVISIVLVSTGLAYTESQADRGAELFAFYCSTCHGDRGQGLTDEFRASWAPTHQNCWTPKCHGLNYPDGGFALPKSVPAVIGPHTLTNFTTAESLYHYIKLRMPFQDPDLLSEEERLAVTAFLLREHGVSVDGKLLDATTVASIQLRADTPPVFQTTSPIPTPAAQAVLPATPLAPQMTPAAGPSAPVNRASNTRWIWVVVVVVLTGITATVVRFTRSR